MLTPKQLFTRLALYVVAGLSTGIIALELTYRFKGVGAPTDNTSLVVEWNPTSGVAQRE